jgi:hypothetical protein
LIFIFIGFFPHSFSSLLLPLYFCILLSVFLHSAYLRLYRSLFYWIINLSLFLFISSLLPPLHSLSSLFYRPLSLSVLMSILSFLTALYFSPRRISMGVDPTTTCAFERNNVCYYAAMQLNGAL